MDVTRVVDPAAENVCVEVMDRAGFVGACFIDAFVQLCPIIVGYLIFRLVRCVFSLVLISHSCSSPIPSGVREGISTSARLAAGGVERIFFKPSLLALRAVV